MAGRPFRWRQQQMKLTDLMPLEKWVAIEKEIADTWGMDANFFDTKGVRISTHKNWANRICPEIKATDKGQSFICAVAHMNVATLAKNSREPVIEECDGGLIKLVVPVFVGEEFVGAFGACGFLLDDGACLPGCLQLCSLQQPAFPCEFEADACICDLRRAFIAAK